MQGDHEPGRERPSLPPFVARPREPLPPPRDLNPLPPWSSTRHDLGGAPRAEPAPEALEEPWTPPPPAAEAEPWSLPTEPPADAEAASEVAEPWPGLESEPLPVPPADDPWTPIPESASEEPWAAAASEPEVHAAEPWAADAVEAEPLVLEEAAGTWELEMSAEDQAPSPWSEGLDQEGETAGDNTEPWTAASPAQAPYDRPESDLPPAPSSPLDELVETAGQALAGSASAWVEAPLDTWPGEADAWSAVAATADAAALEQQTDRGEAEVMADALTGLADDLRARGTDALAGGGRDRLGAALAAFLSGWRAAGRDG